jgi:hypothetical protein
MEETHMLEATSLTTAIDEAHTIAQKAHTMAQHVASEAAEQVMAADAEVWQTTVVSFWPSAARWDTV